MQQFPLSSGIQIEAIKVVDNLAVIDYNICDNRGECFRVCPTNAIAKKENKTRVLKG